MAVLNMEVFFLIMVSIMQAILFLFLFLIYTELKKLREVSITELKNELRKLTEVSTEMKEILEGIK